MTYWTEEEETEEYTARDSRKFLEPFLLFALQRLNEIPIEDIPIMWSTGGSMEASWDRQT